MKKILSVLAFFSLLTGSLQAQQASNNTEIRNKLSKIYEVDQKERAKYDELERQYGWGAKESQDARQKIKDMDQQHLKEVEDIIQKLGKYPGKDVVGQPLDQIAFLIIQHSTDRAVHEKYLPMITEAAQKGNIDKASAAVLTDIVKVQKKEKQVYGTQIHINNKGEKDLYPVEDLANINQRRKDMDLEPLENFLRRMGVGTKP
jgi:hypothetical protein